LPPPRNPSPGVVGGAEFSLRQAVVSRLRRRIGNGPAPSLSFPPPVFVWLVEVHGPHRQRILGMGGLGEGPGGRVELGRRANIHSGSEIGSFGFRGRDFVFVLGTARGLRGRRSPGGTWPPSFALAKLGGRGVRQRASARPLRVRTKLIILYRSHYEYKIKQNTSKT